MLKSRSFNGNETFHTGTMLPSNAGCPDSACSMWCCGLVVGRVPCVRYHIDATRESTPLMEFDCANNRATVGTRMLARLVFEDSKEAWLQT